MDVNLLDLVQSQMTELDSYRSKVEVITAKVVELEKQARIASESAGLSNDRLSRSAIDLLNMKLSELTASRDSISHMKVDIAQLQEQVLRLTAENKRLQMKCNAKKNEISELTDSEKQMANGRLHIYIFMHILFLNLQHVN